MEEKDNNKDRSDAIKSLNKEINGYLKFDTDDLMMSMNNAFEGKKKTEALSPKYGADPDESERERRVKAIIDEATKPTAGLESIMEEHGEYIKDNDRQVAIIQPMTKE